MTDIVERLEDSSRDYLIDKADAAAEIKRLRGELAEVREALLPGGNPRFAKDLPLVTLIEEGEKVHRLEIEARDEEIERRVREIEACYKVQKDLHAEIEQLKAEMEETVEDRETRIQDLAIEIERLRRDAHSFGGIIDEERAEIKRLREENARWQEIMQEELGETLKLCEALGIDATELPEDTSLMDYLLTEIERLRARQDPLDRTVSKAVVAQAGRWQVEQERDALRAEITRLTHCLQLAERRLELYFQKSLGSSAAGKQ